MTWLNNLIIAHKRRRAHNQLMKACDMIHAFMLERWNEAATQVHDAFEVRRWKLGNCMLKLERYSIPPYDGDIITLSSNAEEIAAWKVFDNLHQGRGSYLIQPSFTPQLVKSLIASYDEQTR